MKTENHIRPPQAIVVDDAGIIRMTVSRILEREGYHVKLARNGSEAVTEAERLSPDAMLVDLRMPAMSGLDLVRIIKDKWPAIGIVIITAYADSDMIRQTREHGAMEVLIKPITDLTKLKKVVAKAAASTRLKRKLPVREEALLRQILLMRGIVEQNEFEKALSRARDNGKSVGYWLVRQGSISERGIEKAVQEFLLEGDDRAPAVQNAGNM